MRRVRVIGLGVGLLVLSTLSACSDAYVGRSEEVTLVVHDQPPCNVGLVEDEASRHGRHWYSKASVRPQDHLPGEVPGTLTYTSEREAIFEGGGIRARFVGREPDQFVQLDCPVSSELWNPPGQGPAS